MIYFDNAATGGVKPGAVINAVVNVLKKLSVNAGRSSHTPAVEALALITSVREQAAAYFGAPAAENVIFTKNCSEALNMAILGTAREGGEILLTANEHNSVIRPCFELERMGKVRLKVIAPEENGGVCAETVEKYITERTYLVCVNYVSNVTGGTSQVREIAGLCRGKGILSLVDCAQSGGHLPMDMRGWGVNLVSAACHKGLLSPQGLGLLCINDAEVRPLLYGGTGTESQSVYQPAALPEALECGTLNLPAIGGLDAAFKFLRVNEEKMKSSLRHVFRLLYDGLKKNPTVTVYSYPNECGIVSFLANGYDSVYVGDVLSSKFGIAVRAGLHCAPLAHKAAGTLQSGLVRASLSPFNTAAEVKSFLDAVDFITYN
jgi:selenocysteine lyase/cysteine desulfurase